ncbi:MAG TPA: TolC family protein [Bryobacteraceae bacterium]|nr:TolC family protein [Bryobacteraceae bacterium]
MTAFRLCLALHLAALLLLAQPPDPPPPEPISIDQAVREALDHNLTLVAERFNVPIANARILTAGLRPNPVLTLDGDYLDVLGTGFAPENGAGPAEGAARVDFVLERGRKRERRVQMAELAKSVAELNMLNATRTVIFEVESAFVDVLLAKESYSLAQENLKALNAIVDVNSTRVRTGDLAQVELVRSKLAALQFQNNARQAEFKLKSARHRLQLLMGRPSLTHGFDVKGPMRRESDILDIHAIRQLAQEHRPDLLAVKRDQARSAADLRLQIAQGKVDYTVGTQYHRQQSPTGTGNSLGVFLSLPIPVFNRNQGEIERARLEEQQLATRVRALSASIASEVETGYEQYATSRNMLDSLEKDMLQQAQDVRKTTEYSYRRGEASLIEFLDAQKAFNDTMQSYHDARADYARSLYLLDSTSGKVVNP